MKPSLRVPREVTMLGLDLDEKEQGDGQVVQNKEKRPADATHTARVTDLMID